MTYQVTDIDAYREDGSVQRLVVIGGRERAMSTARRCYRYDFVRFAVVGERMWKDKS